MPVDGPGEFIVRRLFEFFAPRNQPSQAITIVEKLPNTLS
jgi:hypothetical protein